MFDDFARSLFSDFPEFEGMLAENAARALSRAYLAVIEFRINRSQESVEGLGEVQPFLRRLANTLLFHVILDNDREDSERQAAAFVAGEAIALMADYLVDATAVGGEGIINGVRSAERFARTEASLLYLFARYDACAAGVVRQNSASVSDSDPLIDLAAHWALEQIDRLSRLNFNFLAKSVFTRQFHNADSLNPFSLEEDTVARLYVRLGSAANDFCRWLVGADTEIESIIYQVDQLIDALSLQNQVEGTQCFGYEFGRIYHLSVLLKLCLPSLARRALVHVVPTPSGVDASLYSKYLKSRAVGSDVVQSRPLLWPSAFDFVRECLLGDTRHCVAAMPTGSGKSFVAELAVSQSIQTGWALYLAPTNALTEQIRSDLRKGLKDLDTEIFAFIGDQEYSIFTAERVDQMPNNSVAVMTPEKCALALRLSPEAFRDCRLVVFDECHLLGEGGSTRGPLAELVLTQLMLRAPNCRFLLMSAIVQNPEDLAAWLQEATGAKSRAVTIRWRPTRTLRAVLGVDNVSVQERAPEAISQLNKRSEKVKKAKFASNCALAVNLQGAWQSESQDDYTVTRVHCDAPLKVVRKWRQEGWKYYWEGDSWVNNCAISLATKLAASGIQTLVFTPASKHYPFNNGKKVKLPRSVLQSLPLREPIADICLTLAEYELGAESKVFSLLDRGVSVHTSLMLETEKIAAESAFRSRATPIMFATGTLAQGLNLPAIAVIIAGSRIGDPRGDAEEEVERRKFSQLLNAAGRAGRAGFANQGLVVAVPDKPVAFSDFESVKQAREQVDYLQQSDASVTVESGLSSFLDSICLNALRSEHANDIELQVISLLAGGDENQIDPKPVLQRTYAAYLRRKHGASEVTEENSKHLLSIGTEFIKATQAPAWLTVAAQRSGLDFFLMLAISQAWGRLRQEWPANVREWSLLDWRAEFLRVVATIPPRQLTKHLSMQTLQKISPDFKKIDLFIFYESDLSWVPPKIWLDSWRSAEAPLSAWMSGKSIVDIASILIGAKSNEIDTDRTAGKPIPQALAVCQEGWSSLALIAGGFLAIAEQIFKEGVPLSLASLPMCIKYGCDSPGALAWFRFGVRLRRPSRWLADKFPPPLIATDEELKTWIRKARREWLKDEYDENELSRALRAFVTNE